MQKYSFAPPTMQGDLERILWRNVPHELIGKKVTLDELKKLFPKTEELAEIEIMEENKDYNVYGQKDSRKFPIRRAYQCKHCNSVVIGMPECNEEDDLGIPPLAGKRGYSLSCKECGYEIKEFSGLVS